MLPLRPPVGKPAPLVCTYAATGHNSAVLSLDVTEDLMITGSKGWFASYFSFFFFFLRLLPFLGKRGKHQLCWINGQLLQ